MTTRNDISRGMAEEVGTTQLSSLADSNVYLL
jgi:hypothetical protein